MTSEEIKRLIENGIEGAKAEVEGEDGVHFAARIIAPAFRSLSLVKRHQLVYKTLGTRMGGEIHALSLSTLTPEEQEEQG